MTDLELIISWIYNNEYTIAEGYAITGKIVTSNKLLEYISTLSK